MLILTLRTDQPQAEISLWEDTAPLAHESWQAHRHLAETLHAKIAALLESQQKTLQDIEGIVCFKGPGSFTGLRIGLTVANALAASLPAVIAGEMGGDWEHTGITRLINGENDTLVMPEYGAEVHITKPKN